MMAIEPPPTEAFRRTPKLVLNSGSRCSDRSRARQSKVNSIIRHQLCRHQRPRPRRWFPELRESHNGYVNAFVSRHELPESGSS